MRIALVVRDHPPRRVRRRALRRALLPRGRGAAQPSPPAATSPRPSARRSSCSSASPPPWSTSSRSRAGRRFSARGTTARAAAADRHRLRLGRGRPHRHQQPRGPGREPAIAIRLASGEIVPATIVGTAPNYDLAVLRLGSVRQPPPPIAVGTSARPQGRAVRLRDRQSLRPRPDADHRRHQRAPAPPADRRGPRDRRRDPDRRGRSIRATPAARCSTRPGRLIGVNTAIFSPSGASAGIGFAIPVDVVNRVVPQLIRTGRMPTPGIGIIAGARTAIAARLGIDGVVVDSHAARLAGRARRPARRRPADRRDRRRHRRRERRARAAACPTSPRPSSRRASASPSSSRSSGTGGLSRFRSTSPTWGGRRCDLAVRLTARLCAHGRTAARLVHGPHRPSSRPAAATAAAKARRGFLLGALRFVRGAPWQRRVP